MKKRKKRMIKKFLYKNNKITNSRIDKAYNTYTRIKWKMMEILKFEWNIKVEKFLSIKMILIISRNRSKFGKKTCKLIKGRK